MEHVVGQHQVHQCIHIRTHAEVLAVVPRELHLQPVVAVHHAGHAVEAEPVELELLHPVPQVGQQEAQHLPAAVVEAAAVPHPVVPLGPVVEVLAVGAVELVDAVQAVGGGVRVHDVHHHRDAVAVRCVDEVLELIRRAAPRGHGEEVGDVVPERRVVRVLLHRHELHGVVAQRGDARQHVVRKLHVAVDLGLHAGHADVRLVDAQLVRGVRPLVLELVDLLRRRVVVDAVEGDLPGGLHRELDPSRDAVNCLLALDLQVDLHAASVRDGGGPVRVVRQEHLKDAEVVLLHPRAARVRLPVVEVAEQRGGLGVGCPLAVGDALVVAGEAHGLVAAAELLHAALVLVDGVAQCAVLAPAEPQVPLVRVQRLVVHEDAPAVRGDRRVHKLRLGEAVLGLVDGADLGTVDGRGVGARRRHRHECAP
mmetsp:Transcript_35037/g.85875  ORF Transcript_35037/g.85875 Transcript_35037/m.85875 type:complete len:423 (-) Transcript_35037:169-1437(-)